MENKIMEIENKKIDVEKVAKDLALDQQPKQEVKKEIKYDQLYEDLLKKQRDSWMDLLNQTIIKAIDCEMAAWVSETKKYPEKKTISPYARVEEMFECFIGEFKKRHNQYLEEHNLLTRDQKEGIVRTKAVKSPFAEVVNAKQIKNLIK